MNTLCALLLRTLYTSFWRKPQSQFIFSVPSCYSLSLSSTSISLHHKKILSNTISSSYYHKLSESWFSGLKVLVVISSKIYIYIYIVWTSDRDGRGTPPPKDTPGFKPGWRRRMASAILDVSHMGDFLGQQYLSKFAP